MKFSNLLISHKIAIALLAVGCCHVMVNPQAYATPTDEYGWSVFTQSPDDRTIYVSSSLGDDSNSGLNQNQPVATVEQGKKLLRNGYADHLLFRSGDRFGPLGKWPLSGRSENEMMLISSYGNGPRPVFDSGKESNLSHYKNRIGHVAFVGLHLIATDRLNDANNNAAGFHLLANTENILIEDCRIELYRDGITLQKLWGQMQNIRIRRCIIRNCFATNQHAMGLFAKQVDGLLLEQNLFDHNGWLENPDPDGTTAPPTKFNHNIYIQHGTTNVIMRENILARGSSHGAQVRNGGLVENNLFLDNAIGLMVASDEPAPFSQQLVRRNIVIHPSNRTLENGLPRGWGFDIFRTSDRTTIEHNLAIHNTTTSGPSQPNHLKNQYLDGIMTYQWADEPDSNALKNTRDPNRTIATYHQALGRPASIDSFLYEAAKQSKQHWQPAYTAAAVNQYLRSGFNMDSEPSLEHLEPVAAPSIPAPLIDLPPETPTDIPVIPDTPDMPDSADNSNNDNDNNGNTTSNTPSDTPEPPQNLPAFELDADGNWVMETERMRYEGFILETHWPVASYRLCLGLSGDDSTGQAYATFAGPDGTYDLSVRYFDEDNGNATYQIHVDDQLVASWMAKLKLGSSRPDINTIIEPTLAKNITLTQGQTIKLSAAADGSDYARVDQITFTPSHHNAPNPSTPSTQPTPPTDGTDSVPSSEPQSNADLPERIDNLESRLESRLDAVESQINNVESRISRAAQSLAD